MHEISAAHGVLQAILGEASSRGLLKVTRAEVSVNTSDGLSPDNLAHWFQSMSEGTLAEGAAVVVHALCEADADCPRPGDIRLDMLEGIIEEP